MYFLIAACIQALWGITPSASQIVLRYMPVEQYATIRYLFSSAIFLSVSFAMKGSFQVSRTLFPKLAFIGVLTYALNSLGTLYGLRVGGVLNFSLASSMNAVVTALVAIIVLRESAHRNFKIAALLSVCGGLCLFWGKLDVSNFQIAAGSLCLIWSAYILEALGLVFSKSFKNILPLTEYIGIMQLCAGSFMLGITTAKNGWHVTTFAMPAEGWLALSFVCFVSCCLCYFVQYWLLNHIDGHRLAFFDCFHTIVSAFLGVAAFSEPYNIKMLIGGGLLLGAVFLIMMREKVATQVAPPHPELNAAS